MATLALDITLNHPAFELRVAKQLVLTGITALFGPSGAGKTTLLRAIAGLEPRAVGSVTFDGEVWQDAHTFVPTYRRQIGYVFQDGRLFTHLTVEDNLRFALRRAVDRTPPNLLATTIDALELRALLTRRPASLSGGEQQRVAIARALLTHPRLLLMDEPLSSLDTARKREIVPIIERLPAQFGIPVLYVTHNLDEVANLATDVVLLAGGRVAAHELVANAFERPDLDSLLSGLESAALLRTRVVDHRDGIAALAVGSQQLRVPLAAATIGATRNIRVLARDVAIATARPEHLSIRNVLAARILSIEPRGNMSVELLLDLDGSHLRSRITRAAAEELALTPGQNVYALIKSVALESLY